MGAGIAKQIRNVFPEAYEADLKTNRGDIRKLGSFSSAQVLRGNILFRVVNAYTQFKPGPYADLYAIKKALESLSGLPAGPRIGLPQIGCGIGGLSWKDVEDVIDTTLSGEDVTVVIWDVP